MWEGINRPVSASSANVMNADYLLVAHETNAIEPVFVAVPPLQRSPSDFKSSRVGSTLPSPSSTTKKTTGTTTTTTSSAATTTNDNHGSTSTTLLTPKCWKSATTVLAVVLGQAGIHMDDTDVAATQLCALLPVQHQKWLALEMARCHLEDLGRSLFRDKPLRDDGYHHDSTNNNDLHNHRQPQESYSWCSPHDPTLHPIDLDQCLRQLSETGADAYMHFITYVQQLCIRLTQEMFLEQQQDELRKISTQYHDISAHSLEQMSALRNVADRHAEQLKQMGDIPVQIHRQLTEKLHEDLSKTLQSSLHDELHRQLPLQLEQHMTVQVGRLLNEQAVEHAFFMENILRDMEIRDHDNRERHELWMHYQTSLWQTHAKEVEKQRHQIEDHRRKMELLSESVMEASRTMKFFVGINDSLNVVSLGYTTLVVVFRVAVVFNLLWLLTRSTRFDGIRSYLFFIAIVEIVMEGVYGYIKVDRDVPSSFVIDTIRWVAACVSLLIYFVALLVSLCKKHKKSSVATHNYTTNTAMVSLEREMDEIKKQHYDLLHDLRAGHPPNRSILSQGNYRNPPPLYVQCNHPQQRWYSDLASFTGNEVKTSEVYRCNNAPSTGHSPMGTCPGNDEGLGGEYPTQFTPALRKEETRQKALPGFIVEGKCSQSSQECKSKCKRRLDECAADAPGSKRSRSYESEVDDDQSVNLGVS